MQGVCNGIHRSLAANFRYGLVWYVYGLPTDYRIYADMDVNVG